MFEFLPIQNFTQIEYSFSALKVRLSGFTKRTLRFVNVKKRGLFYSIYQTSPTGSPVKEGRALPVIHA